MLPFLLRLASHVWPVRAWKGPGRHGDLDVVWEYGRLVVNSADANQSFGALHRVWQQAFQAAGVAGRRPTRALVLGFGAGSVAHILRQELHLGTHITGVDDDPAMLGIAREHFGAAAMNDLLLREADAFAFARELAGPYDLIVVDLFHNAHFTPGVEEPDFVGDLRRLASPGGLVLVNTMVESPELQARSALLERELRLRFTEVKAGAYEENNRVFIAL